MPGSETVRVVQPEERRSYVPTDIMSLAQYAEFKTKFNERLLAENAKIEAKNAKLHVSQPPTPLLEEYPVDTVLMLSEARFIITLPDFKRVLIPIGIFECPIELSDNWYLKAHKVIIYVHPVRAPLQPAPEVEKELDADGTSLKSLIKVKPKKV